MDFSFGSKSTHVDPVSCLIGFLVGYLMSHGFNGIIVFIFLLTFLYLVCILVVRSILCFVMNFVDINDYVALSQSQTKFMNKNDILRKKPVESVLSIEYNMWSNIITVSRDMKTVICTDKDLIVSLCKKYINIFLFWDIFFHAYPLQIIFK